MTAIRSDDIINGLLVAAIDRSGSEIFSIIADRLEETRHSAAAWRRRMTSGEICRSLRSLPGVAGSTRIRLPWRERSDAPHRRDSLDQHTEDVTYDSVTTPDVRRSAVR